MRVLKHLPVSVCAIVSLWVLGLTWRFPTLLVGSPSVGKVGLVCMSPYRTHATYVGFRDVRQCALVLRMSGKRRRPRSAPPLLSHPTRPLLAVEKLPGLLKLFSQIQVPLDRSCGGITLSARRLLRRVTDWSNPTEQLQKNRWWSRRDEQLQKLVRKHWKKRHRICCLQQRQRTCGRWSYSQLVPSRATETFNRARATGMQRRASLTTPYGATWKTG